jgi:hypothetical protein
MVSGWGKVTNNAGEFQETYDKYGAATRTLQVKLFFAGYILLFEGKIVFSGTIYFCRYNLPHR